MSSQPIDVEDWPNTQVLIKLHYLELATVPAVVLSNNAESVLGDGQDPSELSTTEGLELPRPPVVAAPNNNMRPQQQRRR